LSARCQPDARGRGWLRRAAAGRATPHAAARMLAGDGSGPWMADHEAGLEVVRARRAGAGRLRLRAEILAPALDGRRGAEHQIVAERLFAVAGVQTGEREPPQVLRLRLV